MFYGLEPYEGFDTVVANYVRLINKLFNLPLDILLYSAIIIKPHIMGSKKCTSVCSPIVARLMKESYYYVRSYRNRRKAVQGI